MSGWLLSKFGFKDPVYKWYQVPNIRDKRVEIQLIETKIPEGTNEASIPYSVHYTYNANSSLDQDFPTLNDEIQDGMTVNFNWKYLGDN